MESTTALGVKIVWVNGSASRRSLYSWNSVQELCFGRDSDKSDAPRKFG